MQQLRAMAHWFKGGKNTIPKDKVRIGGKVIPWLQPGMDSEPLLGTMVGPVRTKGQLLQCGISQPKRTIVKAIKSFEQELEKAKFADLVPTLRLDVLKIFQLPTMIHTYQCTRINVQEIDQAKVKLRGLTFSITYTECYQKFNGTSTPKGSYRAKTGDNDCNVNSSHYSLSTALCESIRYQAKSEQNVRQDMIPRVRHGEAALCTPERCWTQYD